VKNVFLGQVRVVCLLAVLLMAGGQALHAGLDLACSKNQPTEEHSSCPDRQDCPVDDTCAHSCGIMAHVEDSKFLFLIAPSRFFALQNETWEEGGFREIDHPPQLS